MSISTKRTFTVYIRRRRSEVAAAVVGQAISDEEIDIQLVRLTPEEQAEFMRLTAKMQGRWVEPPAIEEGR